MSYYVRRRQRPSTALRVTGVTGNYASSPHEAVLAPIAGTLRVECAAMPDSATAVYSLVSKHTTAGNQRGYLLFLNSNGTLRLQLSSNGTATTDTAISTVGHGVAAGRFKWFAALYNITGQTVDFQLSDDGSKWTALGTQVAVTGAALFATTSIIETGATIGGTASVFAGYIFRTRIYVDSILRYDAAFDRGPTGGVSLAAAGGQVVTINRSGADQARIISGVRAA